MYERCCSNLQSSVVSFSTLRFYFEIIFLQKYSLTVKCLIFFKFTFLNFINIFSLIYLSVLYHVACEHEDSR